MAKAPRSRGRPADEAGIRQSIRELAAKLPPTDTVRMAIEDLAPAARDLRFLIPREAPPPQRSIAVNLGFRRNASGGDAIRVVLRRRRDRRPIEGASVRLLTMMNDELAVVKTDGRGEALFVAPLLKQTQTLQLALDKKFSRFLPPNHRICRAMGLKHGFTPHDAIVVIPEEPLVSEASLTPVAGSTDFEIDQAFGWADGVFDFKGLIKKAAEKGWQADDDWWASRTGIYEHVEQKTCEDVWNFFGHSVIDGSNRVIGLAAWHKFNWARATRVVSKEGLCRHIQKDGESPGIVFLAACQSADLLPELVKCCVKLAIGFTKPLGIGEVKKCMIAFWEAMFSGAMLGRAIQDINRRILDSSTMSFDALTNPNDARLVYKAKPWIQGPGGKTLEQLLSLRAPGEPSHL